MRYRVFTSPMGKFRDSGTYEFVAEFEDQKLAANYMKYMRDKKRYYERDIIIKELEGSRDMNRAEGKTACVCSAMGEYLVIDGKKIDY